MSLDRTLDFSLSQRELTDKIVRVTANYSMKARDLIVYLTNTATTTTITLPPVGEAAGRFYLIHAIVDGTAMVITDAADDTLWSDLTTNADNEWALIWSSGRNWYQIGGNI